ncbi:MAG: hypothetical protein ABIL01_17555 [Pseudomonadota bacterium]
MARSIGRYSFSIFMFWMLATPSSYAQPQCLHTLVQDKSYLNYRETSSLALMRLIQQSSKKESGWSGNVTVPIYGVPVNFGASGHEKATNSYFDNTKINWSQERLLSVATQTLSKNAVEAYKACVHGRKNNGVDIIVYDARPDAVTVSIRWIAPPGAPTQQSGSVTMSGGRPQNQFPSVWLSGSVFGNIIYRSANEDLRIVANVGNDTDNGFVAYLPPVEWPAPTPAPQPDQHLYVGTTPGVNAGEITSNPAHKNGATLDYGWSIRTGPRAGTGIFMGQTPGLNAAIATTNQGLWRGGQTAQYGFALKQDDEYAAKDLPLYVGVGGRCSGAIANNPAHQGCNMQLFGYAYRPPR